MHDSQTFLIVAGLVLVVIGFVTAKTNLVAIRSAIAASKWASVDGEIESAGVSEGYDYAGANGSKRAIFRVVIRYSYRLGTELTAAINPGLMGGFFRVLAQLNAQSTSTPPRRRSKYMYPPTTQCKA